MAVVSREDLGKGRWGLWVELKTIDGRGAPRIERGLFAPASLASEGLFDGGEASSLGDSEVPDGSVDEHGSPATGTDREHELVIVRYQALSGAKLYEYPVGTARHARTGGEVSTFELFEYDPSVRPVQTTVGPDTLRLGRRVVPALVERVRRYGSDQWPSDAGPAGVQRLVLTQTFWRNGSVPVTGFARSVFRAEMRVLPWSSWSDSLLLGTPLRSRPDSTLLAAAMAVALQADSLLRAEATPEAVATEPTLATSDPSRSLLVWTELTLTDLGSGAKPELTMKPEAPPDSENSQTDSEIW